MIAPFSWRDRIRAWQRFFFEPADTLPCDIIRIGYALVVLVWCVTNWHYVLMWYGQSGVMPYELSRRVIDPDTWTIFAWLPKTDRVAQVCFALMTLQAALLAVGLWSRFQAICVYVWVLSFHHRNVMILDAEDSVVRIVGFLVIFMPIGYNLSIDSWRRRRRSPLPGPVYRPRWALRLLQIEMCVIFAGCAFSKLRGADWLDGTALYYASRLDDLFGRFPTPAFLWESMTIMRLLTWSVIAIEASVPILIWFRETRWLALGLAALFHLVCDYAMNLYLFHWIMLVGWTSFVSGQEWRWLAGRLSLSRAAPAHSGPAWDAEEYEVAELPATGPQEGAEA